MLPATFRSSIARLGLLMVPLLFCAALVNNQSVSAASAFGSKYTVCPSYARLSGPVGLSAYFVYTDFIEISWQALPAHWINRPQVGQAQITIFVESEGHQQNTNLPLSSNSTRFGGLPSSSNFTVSLAVTDAGHVISEVWAIQLDNSIAPSRPYDVQRPDPSGSDVPISESEQIFGLDDAESLLQFLKSGDYTNHKFSNNGGPLHTAAIRDYPPVLEYLLGLPGADPDLKSADNLTALHLAALAGKAASVTVLLKYGANPNATNNDGSTPLHFAAWQNHSDVARLLFNAGADGDLRNWHEGSTPLHTAVKWETLEVLAELLRHENYDLDVRDDQGNSPLLLATKQKFIEPVRLLLTRRDIDPNEEDFDGWTPLMSAAEHNQLEIAEALLSHRNTDPDEKIHPGYTAMIIAIRAHNEDIIELLLDHPDIDPNLPAPDGRTPLHYAAFENQYDIAEMLLDHRDTDPNRKDNYNQTAAVLASFHGHNRISELLQEHGG